MNFDLDSARDILSRTPKSLNSWLRDLPDAWARQDEGPETWCAYDVVGHLIHGERTDWIPRARIILAQGASTSFEPFDRFAQFASAPDESLNDRLDLFAALRKESLDSLAAMRIESAQLALTGVHPEFGTVTLGQLLSTWVVHDLGHVAQIARAMSKGYASAVGPWGQYLPVLQR